jgi:hypothetical protein
LGTYDNFVLPVLEQRSLHSSFTSVAWAIAPSVFTMSSTDISFHHLVFWNLFEFLAAEITLKSITPHILNPNLTK